MFEAALEAGADNVESDEDGHRITCRPDDLASLRDALEAQFCAPASAKLSWTPQNTVPVSDEGAEKLFRLLENLDDSDDVQTVIANYEVSDEAIRRLGA